MFISARFGAQFTPPQPTVVFTDMPSKLTIKKIVRIVSDVLNVSENDIRSGRRDLKISLARQIVYYTALKLTTMTYPQIGRVLKRDHSTIFHGSRKIEGLCRTDIKTAKLVAEVFERFGA